MRVHSDNYASAAVRTEAPYDGAYDRLNNSIALMVLGDRLSRSVQSGRLLDIVKKYVFYNKDNDLAKLIAADTTPEQGLSAEQQALYDRLKNDPRIVRLLHAVIGLQTEVGELAETLGDYLFLGKPIDWTNIAEELGDNSWYTGIACDVLGMTLTQILDQNIAKLRARYPQKFTEELAEHRNLDNERDVLSRFVDSEIHASLSMLRDDEDVDILAAFDSPDAILLEQD